MSTTEIKQELQNIIENSDAAFIQKIYKIAKDYQLMKQQEKMILEGEEDIKNGDVYSINEVKNIMEDWRKEYK